MSRPRVVFLVLPLLLGSILPGCVRRSTHEVVLTDLAEARSAHSALEGRLSEELRERDRREAELVEANRVLQAEIERLERHLAQMRSTLSASNAEVGRLDTLLGQRGAEFRAMQTRLDALRRVEQEIRERNRIYEEMLDRFQSLIDAGQLSISIERGRMVIHLPQDILFSSGSATVGADGIRTVTDVGSVLADLPDRRFQVEGHTDNVPIATQRFPSNWELSSARAMSVIRVLLDAGVSPDNVSGAGYGEFQPRDSNDTPLGRQRNRRIEIVMLPNLDVIATTVLPE